MIGYFSRQAIQLREGNRRQATALFLVVVVTLLVTVLPRSTETFDRSYHSGSRLVLAYTIDVPIDVRHIVRVKRTKTGSDEQGLEQFVIRNDSFCVASVTFFEFEE